MDFRKFVEQEFCSWGLGIGEGKNDLRYIGADKAVSRSVTFSPDGKSAVCRWQGHPEAGKDFSVQVEWQCHDDGLFSGHMSFENYQGAGLVEELLFPVFRFPAANLAHIISGFWNTGVRYGRDYVKPGQTRTRLCSSLQMAALLAEKGENLYFDSRDTQRCIKALRAKRSEDGGEFEFSLVYANPLPGGATVNGSIPYTNNVQFFTGSWYEAGRIYRKWAIQQDWWTKPPAYQLVNGKNPMRDISMWLWNRGSVADVVPETLRLQQDLGDAKVALDWYWWHSNPYDTDYPNYWPPRIPEAEFKAAVAELRKRGIFTQVYINGVCWDHDGRDWEEGGAQDAVVLRNGEIKEKDFNRFNHHRLAWMCGEAPHFHKKIESVVNHLYDAGLSGQYLDMVGCSAYVPCHNPLHKHAKGGGNYIAEGFRKMLKKLYANHPDFPLSTETANEAYMDLMAGGIVCYAGSYEMRNVTPYGEPIPLYCSIYHGKMALFGSCSWPDGIPPWDELWPDKDRWKKEEPWHLLYPDQFPFEVARTLIWGCQPMVSQLRPKVYTDPEFKDVYNFILATGKFYHENIEYLFDGEMLNPGKLECAGKQVRFLCRFIFTRDGEGVTVEYTRPAVLHSVWRAPSGSCALLLANYTREPQNWRFGELSGQLAPLSFAKVTL